MVQEPSASGDGPAAPAAADRLHPRGPPPLQDLPGHEGARRRRPRHPPGRGARPGRSQRLGQVHPHQGAVRLPPPRPRGRGRPRRPPRGDRPARARQARPHRPSELRAPGPGPRPRAEHDRQPGPARRLRPHPPRARPLEAAGPHGPPAASRRSPSTSTSPSRWPRRRRSSARSSPSPPPCRAGTPAVACSCSTSPPPCSPRARSSGSSRSCATCATPGPGILYVSHRLDEIFSLADRVTVLRNGKLVATRTVDDKLTKGELVHLMLGVEMEPDYRARGAREGAVGAPARGSRTSAACTCATPPSRCMPARCSASPASPTPVATSCPACSPTGPGPPAAGSLRLDPDVGVDRHRRTGRPTSVALLPPDRGREGIVGPMTVEENMSLSVLDRFGSPRHAPPPPGAPVRATTGSTSST